MFRFQKEFLEKIVVLGEEEGLDAVAGRKKEERLLRWIVFYVLFKKFNLEQGLIREMFETSFYGVRNGINYVRRRKKIFEPRIVDVCRRIAIGGYYGETGCVSVGESVVAIMKSLVAEREGITPACE